MQSCYFLSKERWSTHLRYELVAKLLMKYNELRAYVDTLSVEKKSQVRLGVTHFHYFRLAEQWSAVELMLIQTTCHYNKNHRIEPAFNSAILSKAGSFVLGASPGVIRHAGESTYSYICPIHGQFPERHP